MKMSKLAEALVALAGGRSSETLAFGSVGAEEVHPLLSPTRLEGLLGNPLLRYPQVRVAFEGKPVPAPEYTGPRRIGTQTVSDGIDPGAVATWLMRGATITLDSLEYLIETVADICAEIGDELGLASTATAYVTPPGRRGLSPHTDEEDVFVLQTFGTKRWIVDPDQRLDIARAAGFPYNDAMQRVAARDLRPGDMFFMPAGTPHVASANDDLSIHITFSVERPRIRDLLKKAIDEAAATSLEFDRLAPWATDTSPLVEDAFRRLSTARKRAAVSSRPSRRLPFGGWSDLAAEVFSVSALRPLTCQMSDRGYALAFPDFTMHVDAESGARLGPLARGEQVRVTSDDAQLKEILFHLVGRGAVAVAPSTVA